MVDTGVRVRKAKFPTGSSLALGLAIGLNKFNCWCRSFFESEYKFKPFAAIYVWKCWCCLLRNFRRNLVLERDEDAEHLVDLVLAISSGLHGGDDVAARRQKSLHW